MTEDNWWSSSPYATAASAKAAAGPSGRAKTTPQDMMVLRDASNTAESERNARKSYAAARKAVADMRTGPGGAQWFDTIIPDRDDSWVGSVTGFVGALPRAFVKKETLEGRDHLNTLGAELTLAKAKSLKGPTSDRDLATLRMAGVDPYKYPEENLRIISNAERESALAQVRALTKSSWISKYGSMSAAGPRGLTYEQALQNVEREFSRRHRAEQMRKRLPKAPPGRRDAGPIEIDLSGKRVR